MTSMSPQPERASRLSAGMRRSIRTVPLFGKKTSLLTWQMYFFDLLMAFFVWGIVRDYHKFLLFSEGHDQVRIFWSSVTVFGGAAFTEFA